ncbi:hypothetical protein FITA111629_14635 [Filibacter tadaridae]|uniref:N-acetyltransferase domain-containing protein n=1 Tax=Filibacter tadaridae TaxID=2483811 RepID=A0A3P5XU26_9BACL|nr:hypothetical protein [Filibacter tadaridae]VDC33799.1 hypothetical protein FILTAD_03054 [Filibacter tadaridae]
MQIVSLSSLIDASQDEAEIYQYLSSFQSEKNEDVQVFLHKKAIPNETRALTRTSLVVDDENDNEIIGYFTLLVKPFEIVDEVSKESRRKLSGDKNTDVFNSILIAQLGRSDLYKGKVSGDAILEFALENCELAYDLVGLRIVCVEYGDVPYLNDFYLKNDFKILQMNKNQKILAYLRF